MSENQQTQLLNSIYLHIKKTSEQMKKSMAKKDLRQVLKYSKEIISQLKTDFISPQFYYQLFTFVFDEILQIQSYFRSEIKQGRDALEFYKSVQQCMTVLPRVYLMIIVGTLLIENNDADANEILDDLIEACNGVQHPIRGLFVRYFFLKILKDYIFDIDLLMINFKEMNKLWTRINKLKYYSKEGVKKVRNDLKVLIGENIMRIAFVLNNIKKKDNNSNIERIFKEKILLPILDIIKRNKNNDSQEYILISLIQVLNEELINNNIEIIINSLNEIKENIDIKEILMDLMEKLSKFKEINNLNINDIFKKFNESINDITDKYSEQINNLKKEKTNKDENLPNSNEKDSNANDKNTNENEIEKNAENENKETPNKISIWVDINDHDTINILELHSSFIKFLNNYVTSENKNEIIDMINKALDKCNNLLNLIRDINKDNPNLTIDINTLMPQNMKILYNLLNALIESPIPIFKFKSFPNLMNFLSVLYKYELSMSILDSLSNKYNLGTIDSKDKLETLIEFIEPMIQINQNDIKEYLLDKSLYKISKLVYVPSSKDPYEQLEMLQMIRNVLINSTKNNNEYLSEKKLLIYFTNYLNRLCLFGLNISEAYNSMITKGKSKHKKSKVHIDFCNNYTFNNGKLDINKEQTFFPFYKLLFKEINSAFEIIKPLSIETTLKLYIQCSQMVNGLKFEDIDPYEIYAYDFINKAILILKFKGNKNEKKDSNTPESSQNNKDDEDTEIIDENKRFIYLTNIIAAVSTMDIYNDEHFNSICDDLEKMSEGLMKRKEQCLSMLRCINLFCNNVEEDTNKILELLQKAKKYAVYSMTNPENTILFVYILNEYVRLDGIIKDFDKTVKVNDVEEIIETINNYIFTMKSENKDPNMVKQIEDYYNNTIGSIKEKKNSKNDKVYKLISSLKL